jgi:hypothetical protein
MNEAAEALVVFYSVASQGVYASYISSVPSTLSVFNATPRFDHQPFVRDLFGGAMRVPEVPAW